MSANIHEIRKQLDALESDLIAKVPEHLFIQHILPLIACDEGHTDLNVWNHLAGSVFNKMAVTDPAGNVLFTLPSIATTPVTPTKRDSRVSLFEIMQGYEARLRVSPVYGKQYFENSIADKIHLQQRDIDTLKHIDEILVKYGRTPHLPKGFGEQTNIAIHSESGQTEDDIGDEL